MAFNWHYPYIRDVLTIDDPVRWFYRDSVAGPVFLLARVVRHAPGKDFWVVPEKPLVIICDVYDGTNGMIKTDDRSAAYVGGRGIDGATPNPPRHQGGGGYQYPNGPGTPGTDGGDGGNGLSGVNVTLVCRRSRNTHIDVGGRAGGAGGAGGNGGEGVGGFEVGGDTVQVDDTPWDDSDDQFHDETTPSSTIEGTPGGNGGRGGRGGAGGNAGSIDYRSISDETEPVLEAAGGPGGRGGPGGAPGRDGNLSSEFGGSFGPGEDGGAGQDGSIGRSAVSEAGYVGEVLTLLSSTDMACVEHWASFRLEMADYGYHGGLQDAPETADPLEQAAVEVQRIIELEPDHAGAQQLRAQMAGIEQHMDRDSRRYGGGNNAVGMPRYLDILPSFAEYRQAFTGLAALELSFVDAGIQAVIDTGDLQALIDLVDYEGRLAQDANENLAGEVGIATTVRRQADDDVLYAQQQLDQAMSDIQAAAAAAAAKHEDHETSILGVLGTVAELGAAVVGMAAAIPTGGLSLVALVPQAVSLADSVFDGAAPITKSLLGGSKADVKAIQNSYDKVDKSAASVVKAGRSIVNFVSLVEQLNQAPIDGDDGAATMALVRRGAELTHEVLLAQNRVTLAQQRLDASTASQSRAASAVERASTLKQGLKLDWEKVKEAGRLALEAATLRAGALNVIAFRALRSVEILTLRDETSNLVLDGGMVHPDLSRAYDEGEVGTAELIPAIIRSWSRFLSTIDVNNDYQDFFAATHDRDSLRLTFTAGSAAFAEFLDRHELHFRIDPNSVDPLHSDAKALSVRVALVGARHSNGDEVSCEVGHGGRYEQRQADGSVHTALLRPLVSTHFATFERLAAEDHGDDSPLTDPRALTFWGRGVGGQWSLRVADHDRAGLDLSQMTEIQIWIRYQFRR